MITSCLVEWQYGSLTHQIEYPRVVEKKPSSINTSSTLFPKTLATRLLLNLRADLDARNKLGRTALFEAVGTGCLAMVPLPRRKDAGSVLFPSVVCLKQMIIL